MVGDRLDRGFELRRLRREPGTTGAISTPTFTPASRSWRTARSRCSGCAVPGSSAAPRLLVDGRHAQVHRAPGPLAHARRAGPRRARPSGLSSPGRPACAPRAALRAILASACSALRSADRDRSPCRPPPARASRTAYRAPAQDLDQVGLDEDDRREVIVGPELELRLVAAREAVVAGVRAAAVRVQRPVERHALHRVQRRAAGDLLVARGVGAHAAPGRAPPPPLRRGSGARASWSSAARLPRSKDQRAVRQLRL